MAVGFVSAFLPHLNNQNGDATFDRVHVMVTPTIDEEMPQIPVSVG